MAQSTMEGYPSNLCIERIVPVNLYSIPVKDEFEGVANDDVIWATVGFCVLSLVVICVLIGLSCFNEFTKSDLTICGSAGMYICCGIACE